MAIAAAHTIRQARTRAGLTLRELARRAATSHSTLAAYEAGRKSPNVDTLERIVSAAGFAVDVQLVARQRGSAPDDKGRELFDALELAAMFPARHATTLAFPRFGSQ